MGPAHLEREDTRGRCSDDGLMTNGPLDVCLDSAGEGRHGLCEQAAKVLFDVRRRTT